MENSQVTLKNYSRILITGGKGFIGWNIAQRLMLDEKKVRVFDREEDVRNEENLILAIVKFKPDLILSLASTAGIKRVEENPVECIETNVVGVMNVLKFKKNLDIKLVHFSTSEAYGDNADRNLETDVTHVGVAGSPRWVYQASKVCADHLIMNADKNALIVRPFNIFGIGQEGHGAIADFCMWAKDGKDITIFGDGDQVRSWCPVDDFIDALFMLINNDAKGIYNVGNPEAPQTILDTAMEIIENTDSVSELVFLPKRDVDISYRVPNIDKLIKETGWKPTRDFHEELKHTIEWWRNK